MNQFPGKMGSSRHSPSLDLYSYWSKQSAILALAFLIENIALIDHDKGFALAFASERSQDVDAWLPTERRGTMLLHHFLS